MKKIFLLLTLISIIACGNTEKKGTTNALSENKNRVAIPNNATPSQIAVTVFNALTSGNMAPVKNGIYFDDPRNGEVFFQYLDMAANSSQYAESIKGYNADYVAENETIDGDTAHVELVGFDSLGNKVRFIVRLQKVDGVWKVHGEHSVFHNTTGNAQ